MAQKRKSKKRRTTAKKAKVYIPAHKIVIVCASVIAFCLFLLLISTFISQQTSKTDYETQITSQFEKPSENDAPKGRGSCKECRSFFVCQCRLKHL